MLVVHGHRAAPVWAQGTAVAIGNFDGVHAGHRALAARARSLADAHGGAAVALTFEPHPSTLLSPAGCPPMLSSLARRLELLADAGFDATVVEPFTLELAGYSADAFLDDIVRGSLAARSIVVGYDFSYGAQRAGTTETLRAYGARNGVEIEIVEPVALGDEVASSTKIRAHLRDGDVRAAAKLLGRPWDIDGEVVHGAKRGRTIGIPTANIRPESDLFLAPGIYAVTFSIEGGPPLRAVASLGTNPTFVEQGGLVLEVYVLDWDGEIYGTRTRTAFIERLRSELKFDSVDALLRQIHADIDQTRQVPM